MDSIVSRTKDLYGQLWKNRIELPNPEKNHYYLMQRVIPEKIVKQTNLGLEVGSGSGFDSYFMGKDNPKAKIVSLEFSEGIAKTASVCEDLPNVFPVQGSVLELPFGCEIFDFVYSFGVIHHTTNPLAGLREISRVLKKGGNAYVYLYEDHSENKFKFAALSIIGLLRRFTTKLPLSLLKVFCSIASPFIVIFFSWPARFLSLFPKTRSLAKAIPFNFGTTLFSVSTDLYDRFGAPLEYRYSRENAINLFMQCSFCDIRITRLDATAGWVVWAMKI